MVSRKMSVMIRISSVGRRLVRFLPLSILRLVALRLAQAVPLILAVSAVTFYLIFASPGSYISNLRASNPRMSERELVLLQERLGISQDARWYNTWARWWWGVASRGDLGTSFQNGRPVGPIMLDALGATALLSGVSMVLAWIAAIPLGIVAALRRNTLLDYAASGFAFLCLSVPGVVLAALALMLADASGWFPPGGMTSQNHHTLATRWERLLDVGHHLLLPAVVLAAGSMATLTRQMRSNLLETLEADFVRTALAKGLTRPQAIFRHALRNALNPLITLLGFSIAGLLSGSFIVETIMNWPGLGRVVYEAFVAKDMYVVTVGVVMGTGMLLLGNLIADILLAWNDPRIEIQ
jgi:peptide/nickel transport system permease protein